MTTLVETRPAPSPSAPWTFPAVRRATADGVTVVASDLPGRALITLRVVLDAGAVADEPGKEGVAQLLAASALRGARGLDEEGLAIAFESFGASPSSNAGFDSAGVGLQVPAGLLAEAAGLVADVVRRPTLDEGEIGKVRAATIDRLAAMQADPNFVADRAARRAYFRPTNRHWLSSSGSTESLADVTVADVRDRHATRWARAPLTVVVVGDLAGVDLQAVADAFAAPTGDVPRAATEFAINAGGRRLLLVHHPGSVQSVLDFTAPGPAQDIPDAAELAVAQSVMVQAFSSRVNQRLREDLGYTYGSRGSFARHRDGGTFGLSTQVRNEVTADAVQEALQMLEASLGDRPMTDEEVDQARDNLVSKFAVQYDGAGAVADALVRRVIHDLEDDERDVMLARLREVTTDDVNAVWRKYLELDELLVTVVGDAEAVGPSLQELGLPTIEE